jgi:hypothetical protein
MSTRLGSRRKRSSKCSLFVLSPGIAGVGGDRHAQVRRVSRAVTPGRGENFERLRLLERVDERRRQPRRTRGRLGHALLDHVVERVLHPGFQRNQPLLRRLLAKRLAGRPVDLAQEGRDRNREGVADDARQPFVVLIFQWWLAGLDQLEVGRHELGLAPARQIAAHQRVEIILERADLVGRPFLRQGGEGVGRGAGAIIVEGRGVAPQRDVDGERDLLERAHAIEPMRADVARQIEQLISREVGGWDPLEDLLVGGIRRLGRAPVLADQRLDRRSVDDVERPEDCSLRVAGLLPRETIVGKMPPKVVFHSAEPNDDDEEP